jgi:hypothetical protein
MVCIPGPEFIKFRDGEKELVCLDKYLTVAQWRLAQQFASKGDDQHTLQQFRMATLLLEMADRNGLPEDAVLAPTLFQEPRDDPGPYGARHWVKGADDIVRYRDKQPNLSVVEKPPAS